MGKFNIYILEKSSTKFASAISSNVIGVLDTCLLWTISLIFGWEEFIWLELVFFLIIVTFHF